MVGPVESPILVEPEVEGVHRRHRRLDVVFECLLDAAGERRQHEHGLEVLLVQDLHPGVAVLVLGMICQPVDLHQRRRVDALGNLAAEQQVQAARLDDRIERRIRDEVVDPLTHHGQGALAVADHLHATAFELLGQVASARVGRLVVVVVDVDRLVVNSLRDPLRFSRVSHYDSFPGSLNGGKLGGRFSKKLVMPSMKSGRSIDSCISFSASALASKTSRIVSAYTCCLITASELGAQLVAMSSA